jgi:hypothetical protein
MSDIKTAISNGFADMLSAAKTGMSNIVDAVKDGFSSAKTAVSNGISDMLSLITGKVGDFKSAGASLMTNFAQGILDGLGSAVDAVKNAVDTIGGLLPGSPAKWGPLSGQGWTQIRGQHLVEDLAAGMDSRTDKVSSVAQDIADLMTLGSNSALAYDQITNPLSTGGSGGGSTSGYTINVQPGAVSVQVAAGADPAEARAAFDGADDQLAESLLNALKRR